MKRLFEYLKKNGILLVDKITLVTKYFWLRCDVKRSVNKSIFNKGEREADECD